MNVLLIRHAEAVDPAMVRSDYDRPLTGRGREQFGLLSEWLSQRGVRPQIIACSPKVRAQETAEILGAACRCPAEAVNVTHWLGSRVDLSVLLGFLAERMVETLAIVGHEPDMSYCVSQLIGGGRMRFVPGTVCSLQMTPPLHIGDARLEWMVSPRLFPV